MQSTANPNNFQSIARWLFVCCAMVFLMALIGAVTRLTESGLSITEWKPITGALPPLSESAWLEEFGKYQQIPQYQILHSAMTLAEFKNIFFWEWLHRLWGRLIGLVFALPYFYFLLRGMLEKKLALKLGGILLLGGAQGFIGWFMVQSGLEVRTYVSPYRLALHLGFALLIYALMLWIALRLNGLKRVAAPRGLAYHGWATLGILAVTMIWGAFTAGLHAGEAYNTWPLMEGEMFPAAAFTIVPQWLNIFENLALVQFIHRWLGPLTGLMLIAFAARLIKTAADAKSARLPLGLGLMAFVQVALGIATLLTHANIALATLHQAGAITLLTLLLINLRKLTPRA